VKPARDLVACRADLVDLGGRDDRADDVVRAVVLKPVEPHIAAAAEDFRIDRVGEVLHVEDALGVDGHGGRSLSLHAATL
jgi:hypothetical protein